MPNSWDSLHFSPTAPITTRHPIEPSSSSLLPALRLALFGVPSPPTTEWQPGGELACSCMRSAEFTEGCRTCRFVRIGNRFLILQEILKHPGTLTDVCRRELRRLSQATHSAAAEAQTLLNLHLVGIPFSRRIGRLTWLVRDWTRSADLHWLLGSETEVLERFVAAVVENAEKLDTGFSTIDVAARRRKLVAMRDLVEKHGENACSKKKFASHLPSCSGEVLPREDYEVFRQRGVEEDSEMGDNEYVLVGTPSVDEVSFTRVEKEDLVSLSKVQSDFVPLSQVLASAVLTRLDASCEDYSRLSKFGGTVKAHLLRIHQFTLLQDSETALGMCVLLDKYFFKAGTHDLVEMVRELLPEGVGMKGEVLPRGFGLVSILCDTNIHPTVQLGGIMSDFLTPECWAAFSRIFSLLVASEYAAHCMPRSWKILSRWKDSFLFSFWWRLNSCVWAIRTYFMTRTVRVKEDSLMSQLDRMIEQKGTSFFDMQHCYEETLGEIRRDLFLNENTQVIFDHIVAILKIAVDVRAIVDRCDRFDFEEADLISELAPKKKLFDESDKFLKYNLRVEFWHF